MQKLAAKPVGRLYLRLALTLLAAWLVDGLCSAFASSLINLNLSVNAVSACLLGVNVVEPLNRSALLWAGAAAPLAVIALGKGDQARADSFVNAALMALVIVGLIYSVGPLPEMEGVQREVIPLMEQYVSIRRFGIVFMLLFRAMLFLFTVQGRMGVSLLLVLVHGAAEVALIFPLVLQGADSPTGVALSVVIADTAAALLGLFFLTRKRSPLRLTLPLLDWKSAFSALLTGLALTGLSTTGSEAAQFLLEKASLQGAPFLAAYTVSHTLLRGSMTLVILLGAAALPILCWSFGAGDGKRVRSAFVWMLAVCGGFALLACLGMCCFGREIRSLFMPSTSPVANEAAVACLQTAAPGIVLLGLIIPCLMYLMAANRSLCVLALGLVGSGMLHHLPQLMAWLELSGCGGGLRGLRLIYLMLTLLAISMAAFVVLRYRGSDGQTAE